jgi:hypothetical protein
MRGSKTVTASIIETYEAFRLIQLKDPWRHFGLAPGQQIFIVNVATSESQGLDTIFAAVKSRINGSEWFVNQSPKEQFNEFHFKESHIIIRSEHSNSASLAGKTAKIVALDETARFKDNSGKASSQMVYDTLARSTKTFGKEGLVLSVSSPIFFNDFQMQLLKTCGTIYMVDNRKYADDYFHDLQQIPGSNYYINPSGLPQSLGYWLATWEMNPHITRESLEPEFLRNPEAAMRDFHAVPSTKIERYYRELARLDNLFDATIPNPIIDIPGKSPASLLKPAFEGKSYRYSLAVDPAFTSDAMGIALSHVQDNKYHIDLAYRFTPTKAHGEIQSEEVQLLIAAILDRFRVTHFTSDTYQYPTVIQFVESKGVPFEQHFVKKAEHDKLKEAIYSNNVTTYTNDILLFELKNLELVKGEKVDHPRGGSKDVVDAVANSIAFLDLLSAAKRPAYRTFDLRPIDAARGGSSARRSSQDRGYRGQPIF